MSTVFFYNCAWVEFAHILLSFQRVKIYCLNEDGKWDDQGTGLVTVDYLEVCLPYLNFSTKILALK